MSSESRQLDGVKVSDAGPGPNWQNVGLSPRTGTTCSDRHLVGVPRLKLTSTATTAWAEAQKDNSPALTSLTNFLRSVHGLATLAVPALAEDGRRFNVDLASGELTPSTPTVKVRESDSALHLYAEGSEGQLRGVIRNWRRGLGSEIPTFDDLPPSSRGKTTGDPLQARAKWVRSLAFGAMPSGSRANP